MTEASRVQKLLIEQNAEIDRLKNRVEELETALLNIVATFGYGSSGGAYKSRYFSCLEIAKAELKHLGLKGNYSNYVKYVDERKALHDAP